MAGPNLTGGGSYGANTEKRRRAGGGGSNPKKTGKGGAIIATLLVGFGWYAAFSGGKEPDKELMIALFIGTGVVLYLWNKASD
jgi:hypothetical protein